MLCCLAWSTAGFETLPLYIWDPPKVLTYRMVEHTQLSDGLSEGPLLWAEARRLPATPAFQQRREEGKAGSHR